MQISDIFKDKKFEEVVNERCKFIQNVYLQDERPWVIGYSGGKDSTVTTDLVLTAILQLDRNKRHKPIFIISSDTMVENPMIDKYIVENIEKINIFAQREELPVTATLIKPDINESFWVNLIGKGYPAPQQTFRWCTDRLKINPANKFVKKQVDMYGEVVMILGVRSSESASRATSIEKHRIEGKVLKKHSTLSNALVFTPIEDFTTNDVWKYLLTKNPNVWEEDNGFLMSLYQDSQDGECPLMVDKKAPSCGSSRFGCWACTVVQEDKSLNGFIQTAKRNKDIDTLKKIIPLAELRNWLKDNRNSEEYRETKRQNGSLYQVQTKEGVKEGLGAYKFEARKLILKKLLATQVETGLELISPEELKIIQEEWNKRLGDLSNSVNAIYHSVYEKNIFEENQVMVYDNSDLSLLEKLCNDENISSELIKRLVKTEQKYYGYIYKHGLYNEIDSILTEEWIHKEEIKDIKFGEKNDNKQY